MFKGLVDVLKEIRTSHGRLKISKNTQEVRYRMKESRLSRLTLAVTPPPLYVSMKQHIDRNR